MTFYTEIHIRSWIESSFKLKYRLLVKTVKWLKMYFVVQLLVPLLLLLLHSPLISLVGVISVPGEIIYFPSSRREFPRLCSKYLPILEFSCQQQTSLIEWGMPAYLTHSYNAAQIFQEPFFADVLVPVHLVLNHSVLSVAFVKAISILSLEFLSPLTTWVNYFFLSWPLALKIADAASNV